MGQDLDKGSNKMSKATIKELGKYVEDFEMDMKQLTKAQGDKLNRISDKIDDKIGGLEAQSQANFAKVLERIDGIKTGMADLDSRLKVVEKDVMEVKKDKAQNGGVPMKELMEIEDKKANLVIFGIPEQTGFGLTPRSAKDKDAQVVDSILEEVARRKVVFEVKFRIGQKEEGKDRPIVLKLRNQHEKYEILDNCNRLKDHPQWKNVHIRQDLTKLQRECRQAHEAQLKVEASQKNAELKNGETWLWKPRGRGLLRHLVKVQNTNH